VRVCVGGEKLERMGESGSVWVCECEYGKKRRCVSVSVCEEVWVGEWVCQLVQGIPWVSNWLWFKNKLKFFCTIVCCLLYTPEPAGHHSLIISYTFGSDLKGICHQLPDTNTVDSIREYTTFRTSLLQSCSEVTLKSSVLGTWGRCDFCFFYKENIFPQMEWYSRLRRIVLQRRHNSLHSASTGAGEALSVKLSTSTVSSQLLLFYSVQVNH
jgi:hypothetical protein